MKKSVLLFLALLGATLSYAQTCVRDSSILVTGGLVSPPPYSPAFPVIATTPACINDPYNMSVTFNVPDSFPVPNSTIVVPLDSIRLATTGAIGNLPTGLTYLCDPPNCVFKKNTLGCVLIYGTPAPSNPIDTVDLDITIVAFSPALFGFPVPIKFPDDIDPNFHYYLIVKPQGQCASGVNTLPNQIASVKAMPNPFSDVTTITVDALEGGDYRFEVFNLLGQRMYSDNLALVPGENRMSFEAGDLADGAYYFVISNGQGRISRMIAISR